ncbi:MAG: general secretion pathway protein GspB [Desulfuromonadales bacterium]|jgi:general secretion pathway protein B
MSFILEALKKSEKERQRGELPGLQSLRAADSSSQSLRRILPVLLLCTLLLNAACLLWWLRSAQKPAEIRTGQTVVRAPEPAPVPAVAAKPRSSAAAENAKPLQVVQAPPGWNELPEPAPAIVSAPTWGKPEGALAPIPLLEELPAAIRRELPALVVTLHYHTADPAARMARINGSILRQGQPLDEQLIVDEITAEGIVFRFRDTRFRLGNF